MFTSEQLLFTIQDSGRVCSKRSRFKIFSRVTEVFILQNSSFFDYSIISLLCSASIVNRLNHQHLSPLYFFGFSWQSCRQRRPLTTGKSLGHRSTPAWPWSTTAVTRTPSGSTWTRRAWWSAAGTSGRARRSPPRTTESSSSAPRWQRGSTTFWSTTCSNVSALRVSRNGRSRKIWRMNSSGFQTLNRWTGCLCHQWDSTKYAGEGLCCPPRGQRENLWWDQQCKVQSPSCSNLFLYQSCSRWMASFGLKSSEFAVSKDKSHCLFEPTHLFTGRPGSSWRPQSGSR